jgi:hypothetical protein
MITSVIDWGNGTMVKKNKAYSGGGVLFFPSLPLSGCSIEDHEKVKTNIVVFTVIKHDTSLYQSINTTSLAVDMSNNISPYGGIISTLAHKLAVYRDNGFEFVPIAKLEISLDDIIKVRARNLYVCKSYTFYLLIIIFY